MSRYFFEVMYDGCGFHGSQVQEPLQTVQGSLNKALTTLLRRPVETFGASRTDEGVHALSNFYHADMDEAPAANLLYKLNAILPRAMAVRTIFKAVNDDLNARFDALSRQYRYRICKRRNPFSERRSLYYPYRLNYGMLQETAAAITAYTDFESFCKRNAQTKTFRCTILQSYWEEAGEEWHYVVEANRFLRGMVRGLVGTQLQAGKGKISLTDFHDIIAAKDCTRADFSVAGYGLYLEHVGYPEGALMVIS